MPVDRPPRPPSPHITPQIAAAILNWIEQNVRFELIPQSPTNGIAQVAELYLEQEVHPNYRDALIELEDGYDAEGKLLTGFQNRVMAYARALLEPGEVLLPGERPEDLIREVPKRDIANAFLLSLPGPELLTALELAAYRLDAKRDRHPDLFGYLDGVFRARGLPYIASAREGISWVGEPAVRERAIEPALSALADPRLVDARKEFDKARGHLRRGESKDAGKASGDAVETTMAVLLGEHGHPQPQTKHGTDLVQANKLFAQLKSTAVGLLNEDRDKELIYAAMKVRNACGHGAGANPKPPDPAYVEAGVAAAALAITYLASKLP